MQENIVLKIGGSLVYDKNLNVNMEILSKVKDWYYKSKEQYGKIVMVVGGGAMSRDMQGKLGTAVEGDNYLHNIAMSVTQTNAALIQGILGDPEVYSPQKLGDAYEHLWEKDCKSIVTGGLRVGWSTDMDAAVFADILNTKVIYKISDIDYIYDKDPKQYPDAKEIRDMTWEDYFELFNIKDDSLHKPNGKMPIDVVCAKFCMQKGVSFFISGGESIKQKANLKDVLQEGTLIHN